MSGNYINVDFNFFSEIKEGQDPDSKSKTLKRYHQLLWSKELPNGKFFDLKDDQPKLYLYHKSDLGDFVFGSDAITHSYKHHKRKSHIIDKVPQEAQELFDLGSTIASYTLFPKNRINNGQTINMARGVIRLIDDRFDLTLECIKRYYKGVNSPLYTTLLNYKSFFDLFGNFQNYNEYFLLQDLVNLNDSSIKFYLPFDDFKTPPDFNSIDEYLKYKSNVVDFISKRKSRIDALNK